MARKKRKDVQYPGLDPNLSLKTRSEEIRDIASYAGKLPEDAKEWLNRFAEEEININFNHGGELLNNTDEKKRKIYNRNNARNRCIFTREKAQGCLNYLEDMNEDEEVADEEIIQED